MAASNLPCDSQQVIINGSDERKERIHQLQHSDQPCDITLVVNDGKQFRAHRNVLSNASSFFEKMLESDWKESREGVIRLESLTGEIIKDILEFIYSDSVHLRSVERAEDLIVAADYLFLPNLKVIARRFIEQSLSMSNYSSVYEFARRYQCVELMANIKKFMSINFAFVANEGFLLNLPSHEVEQLISRDDLYVSAEDDVFKFIVKWIYHDKKERKKNFQELFRHVRLSFVSRDYLRNEVSRNNFVKQNEVCLSSVTCNLERMNDPVSRLQPFSKPPRTVFQPEGVVAFKHEIAWIYVPTDDVWYKLPGIQDRSVSPRWFLTVRNKLFAGIFDCTLLGFYDPLLNIWTNVPPVREPITVQSYRDYTHKDIIAVRETVCALLHPYRASLYEWTCKPSVLLKYNLDSQSSQTVPSFDWGPREDLCLVSLDRYLYAIGGQSPSIFERRICLCAATRYDTILDTWEKIANIQEARHSAFGAAADEKVFIAGGYASVGLERMSQTCEMYNVSTNEWQFIANLTMPRAMASMVCVEGKLYVLGGRVSPSGRTVVECYDREKNEWKKHTVLPSPLSGSLTRSACSIRIYKGVLANLHSVRTERLCDQTVEVSASPPVEHNTRDKTHRCKLM